MFFNMRMCARSLYYKYIIHFSYRFSLRNGLFPYFCSKTPKNRKKSYHWKSMSYKKKCIFLHFFYNKIWSYQKKAVLLHPLSLKKRAAPKNESLIFEKMSIHNKIVVQELIWILMVGCCEVSFQFSIFNFQLNLGSLKILHLINRLFWAIL